MSSPETEPTDPATNTDETETDATDADTTDADTGDDRPPTEDERTEDERTEDERTEDATDPEGTSLLSGLPPLTPPEKVEPVRRRRRRSNRGGADDASPSDELPMPSLTSPLLSGRSLEPTRPKRRFELLRDHPRWLIAAAVVVVIVVGLVAGKLFAERAADSAMEARSAELEELLADATPEEFLAFSSGVEEPGSIAERTRNLDGFVNVKATAAQSFIRFQPSGWWAGFTERCLVAVVRADGATVSVPKKACVQVEAPPS